MEYIKIRYFESKPTGLGWLFVLIFVWFAVLFFANETEYFFGVMTLSPDLASNKIKNPF